MKALVLAGGFDQIELIKELKLRGCEVILADYNKEPLALSFCDKHLPISTLDFDKVKEAAVQEQVNLVVTACTDQALLIAARVAEELNLFFTLDYAKARNLTNKSWMKQVLVDAQIPTAKHIVVSSEEELGECKSRITYPLIIKPVDSNSSKGVSKVLDETKLFSIYLDSKKQSREGRVIIEEFKEGFELSIDAVIDWQGQSQVLMVSRSIKNDSEIGAFPISASFTPLNLSSEINDQIISIVQKISKAFDLKNTPLLVQAIVTSSGVYVLELSARMGGGCKCQLVEAATGLSLMKLLVSSFFKEKIHLPKVSMKTGYFIMKYVYARNGFFSNVSGEKDLIESRVIENIYMLRISGSEIKGKSTSTDRVCALLIKSNSVKELEEKLDLINQRLKVFSTENEDLYLKDDILNSNDGLLKVYIS